VASEEAHNVGSVEERKKESPESLAVESSGEEFKEVWGNGAPEDEDK